MQDLSSLPVSRGFRDGNAIKVQLQWAMQATTFVWSPQVLYRWRTFLLCLFGAKVGKNVVTRPSVEITYPWELALGDYAWAGDDVNLYILGEITIGVYPVISQKSYLCTGSHNCINQHFTTSAMLIVIGEKCWLATDVFVVPGVAIGDGTAVGARSSVFKPLPANVVCRENPTVMMHERAGTEQVQEYRGIIHVRNYSHHRCNRTRRLLPGRVSVGKRLQGAQY